MMIQAKGLHFSELNARIRAAEGDICIQSCLGQRYIASGMRGKRIEIHGTPGNALGAYLDDSSIVVYGNVQDATGDTMNAGSIFVHGSAGDATGYAMRGGAIYVRDAAGYRAGIHMKAYEDRLPVLVIGGSAGSFLGEYQAGGVIVVLGLDRTDGQPPIGNFCGTGMHGGRIYLRCSVAPELSPQVDVRAAEEADLAAIANYVRTYAAAFGRDADEILSAQFFVLSPNSKNPYKQMYVYH